MGNTYRNIYVHSVDEQVLRTAVAAEGREAFLCLKGDWSVLIPRIRSDRMFWANQQKLAQGCSVAAACLVVSVYVHDSDYLLLEVFRNGEFLGSYASAEDFDQPEFRGISPESLSAIFERPQTQAKLVHALERKKSKRGLERAVQELLKEFEGRHHLDEFQERFRKIIFDDIHQAPPPFLFAEDQHLAICDALGLPPDTVGVDFADVANEEADISAMRLKAPRIGKRAGL